MRAFWEKVSHVATNDSALIKEAVNDIVSFLMENIEIRVLLALSYPVILLIVVLFLMVNKGDK
jgi:hypothetical protein